MSSMLFFPSSLPNYFSSPPMGPHAPLISFSFPCSFHITLYKKKKKPITSLICGDLESNVIKSLLPTERPGNSSLCDS